MYIFRKKVCLLQCRFASRFVVGGGVCLGFVFTCKRSIYLNAALKVFGLTVGKNGESGHGHCG